MYHYQRVHNMQIFKTTFTANVFNVKSMYITALKILFAHYKMQTNETTKQDTIVQ